MPRQARKQSETEIYHVMLRGMNKEYIFKNNAYKAHFINEMQRVEKTSLLEVITWCIMDNHAHLLIKAPLSVLSKGVKVMCLKHAAYYNIKENREGPVFGDRYKSEVVENEPYLLQVIRYIFNNPVKARLVKNPEDYEWSNYNNFLQNNKGVENGNNVENSSELQTSCRENSDLQNSSDFDDICKLNIMGLFNYDMNAFIQFLKQVDTNEYLEIKEDQEKYRIEAGQDIIQEFFESKGIVNEKELKINSEWIDELVVKMITGTKLTLRQVAKLTGLSVSQVYEKSCIAKT